MKPDPKRREPDLFDGDPQALVILPSQQQELIDLLSQLLWRVANAQTTVNQRAKMTKIGPEHRAGRAYVYVRQSTADQLRHNHESRRRQYALADRARTLGWSDVVVIDDDLGVSAGGVARPGFERLLAAICSGEAGAVVSIEASRLARNGHDWVSVASTPS